MAKTVAEIANNLGAEVVGDASQLISGVASLAQAQADYISFIDTPERAKAAIASAAGCLIVPIGVTSDSKTLIQAKNPKLAFARTVELFQDKKPLIAGVHPSAVISVGVSLDEGVRIGPCAVIEDEVCIGAGTDVGPGVYVGEKCVLGTGCVLHPNVVLYPGVTIGDRVTVHAGAVLGSDGFGYVVDDGVFHKFPQIGRLEVGDDVEIGANTTVDRGALDATVIRQGVKLDNLVQIGHNVSVGEHSILSAQVGVAGSAIIERDVILAGQVGVADHVTIGRGARVGAQAGVFAGKKIRPEQVVGGTPARPLNEWKTQHATASRLPKWKAELEAVQTRMAELEAKVGELPSAKI